MMNGIVLRADSLRSEGLTEEFIESLQEMNGLWSRISPWQKKEAQQLVEASGFSDLESVPLAHWLKCNGTSLGASVDAWCRFVDKGLPDLPELDELRQSRQTHVNDIGS